MLSRTTFWVTSNKFSFSHRSLFIKKLLTRKLWIFSYKFQLSTCRINLDICYQGHSFECSPSFSRRSFFIKKLLIKEFTNKSSLLDTSYIYNRIFTTELLQQNLLWTELFVLVSSIKHFYTYKFLSRSFLQFI